MSHINHLNVLFVGKRILSNGHLRFIYSFTIQSAVARLIRKYNPTTKQLCRTRASVYMYRYKVVPQNNKWKYKKKRRILLSKLNINFWLKRMLRRTLLFALLLHRLHPDESRVRTLHRVFHLLLSADVLWSYICTHNSLAIAHSSLHCQMQLEPLLSQQLGISKETAWISWVQIASPIRKRK